MSPTYVVISALHPVIGNLYLEMVPASENGSDDAYQLTDCLYHADFIPNDWRVQKRKWGKEFLGHGSWDQHYIKQHLRRINWFDNEALKKLEARHSICLKDLACWVADVSRWQDIAVSGDKASNVQLMPSYTDHQVPNR